MRTSTALLLASGCGLFEDPTPFAGADTAETTADTCTELDYYLDADGDGWGTGEAVRACNQPDDYVAASGDCDDTDAEISPAAHETCATAYDDDCDGDTSDGDDPATWFPDADGDGAGDNSTSVVSCQQPKNAIATGGDCDDSTADLTANVLVGYTSEKGFEDLTETFAEGTSYRLASWSPDRDGTLYVCPGTWYVAISISNGKRVDIVGYGLDNSTLSGGGVGQILNVYESAVTLSNLSLIEGYLGGKGVGGAAYLYLSSATMTDCAVRDSEARWGGGVSTYGEFEGVGLTIDKCEFTDNRAREDGGALYVSGALDETISILSSTFSGNQADALGGAVSLGRKGVVNVVSSAFDSNTAQDSGGAVHAYGEFTFADSSFSRNAASGLGGALYIADVGGYAYGENATFSCSSSNCE